MIDFSIFIMHMGLNKDTFTVKVSPTWDLYYEHFWRKTQLQYISNRIVIAK